MNFPLLVFTDLDGSLLDHHSYSFKGAEEALVRLHQFAIPLVLTSSKTRAEIQKLQKLLGLDQAFIAENGGGFYLPAGNPMYHLTELQQAGEYRCKLLGVPYGYIREIFIKFRDRYALKGFGDMRIEEIMQATGLRREDAILAAQRDFSEPFLFLKKSCPQELREEVAPHGLTITRGGRFYHLMSSGQDKGQAVLELIRLYQAACQERLITVGLGDAENDLVMLRVVDIPVLIPKPDGSFASMNIQRLRHASFPGSSGWGAAVMEILSELEQEYNDKERSTSSPMTP
jgi:mannosyl-3-phosphoglycerate phosphatase